MGDGMWPAEWVIKRYFSLDGTLLRTVDRQTAAEHWGVDKNYASVALHEMREALLVDRIGRGRYLSVAPERWVHVYSFLLKDSEISAALAKLLRDSMGDVECLVLYGSRTWGAVDELSDWDFLIVVHSREAKERMLSKLPTIEQQNPRFDAEVLSLQDFEQFLRKDPIFLKLVEHDGEAILDFGIMGIVQVAKITSKHVAVELFAAKESILRGLVAARRGRKDIACYWLARGARRTLAAKLTMQSIFSGRVLEEEFAKHFGGYEELRAVCREVRAGRKASISNVMLKELIKKAVIGWERTSQRLRRYGEET